MQTPILKYLPDYYRMFVLPGLMLIIALAGAAIFKDSTIWTSFWIISTWVLASLCLVLGVNFRSTQIILMSLIVAISLWVFTSAISETILGDLSASFLYLGLSLLIPLNILAASFQRGRVLFGPDGLPVLWLIMIVVGVLLLVANGLGGYLDIDAKGQFLVSIIDLFNSPSIDLYGPVQAPSPLSTVFFLAAFVVLLVRHVKDPEPELASGIVVLFAFYLIMLSPANLWVTTMLHLAAVLILIVSLVQLAYRMAFLDDLTGLPARRAMTMEMSSLRGNFTIAMVDVDHFKKVNDTYGHDTGDQVLRMVAKRLKEVTGGGMSYRYGGEEFAVLFLGRSKESCVYFLETLRDEISLGRFLLRDEERPKILAQKKAEEQRVGESENKGFSVTVSIGVADDGDGYNPGEIMKAADEALYRAKGLGRNRVVLT